MDLLAELVRLPGPPGQEDAVRQAFARHAAIPGSTDAKGNLIFGDPNPRVVVTAHLDEIALIVRRILGDGSLVVGPLGGAHPWKWGELPMTLLARESVPAVLSFGSIHTEDPAAVSTQAKQGPLTWDHGRLRTGLSCDQLAAKGVRPGTRAVIAEDQRGPIALGELVAGRFFDDRADLVAMLLMMRDLGESPGVAFVASASEETGGDGALYALQSLRPEVCLALEISPNVPDAPVEISPEPALWVNDGYSACAAADIDLVADLRPQIQFQALSRGGSDASIAAARGLCARPITLGIPVENSHGFEIMHPGAVEALANLAVQTVRALLT